MQPDDPFDRIPTPPMRIPDGLRNAGEQTKIEDVEGLQQQLRERTTNQDRTEGTAVSVVGSDGKLNAVRKHSTYATPSAYPTALRVVSGSLTIYIDPTEGVKVLTGSGVSNYTKIGNDGVITLHNGPNVRSIVISQVSFYDDIKIDKDGVKVTNVASSDFARLGNDGKVTVYDSSSANSLVLDPSAITHAMTIREINVCDGGVAKKMLVVGSAPYT
jgi:hypothetical protein